jgi:hypothetical protein
MDPVWREFITHSTILIDDLNGDFELVEWCLRHNCHAMICCEALWKARSTSPVIFFHRQTVTRTVAWGFHYRNVGMYHHALCIIWFIWLTKLSSHAFKIISPASTGLVISVGCIVDTLVSLWQIFSAQSLPHLLWVRLFPFAGSLHFRTIMDKQQKLTSCGKLGGMLFRSKGFFGVCNDFASGASSKHVVKILRYMLTLSG